VTYLSQITKNVNKKCSKIQEKFVRWHVGGLVVIFGGSGSLWPGWEPSNRHCSASCVSRAQHHRHDQRPFKKLYPKFLFRHSISPKEEIFIGTKTKQSMLVWMWSNVKLTNLYVKAYFHISIQSTIESQRRLSNSIPITCLMYKNERFGITYFYIKHEKTAWFCYSFT